jgi:hypothetical protein
MKYLLESSKFNQIDQICREYGIENYTINPDESIDVNGDVHLEHKGLSELPLKFGIVSANFYCDNNQLTSLEGAPKKVYGSFYCNHNKLTSLEGAPEEIGTNFDCSYNRLTSLEGAPREVGRGFYCDNNQLNSLQGAPREVGANFRCHNNPLPQLILDNMNMIKHIIKNQEDYSIWRRDGTLDESRFREMMREI